VTGIRGHAQASSPVSDRACVVIGADGRHSLVAKAVRAEQYNERPSRCAMYYAYWSDLDVDGFVTTMRTEHRRGWAAARTHDGLTVLGTGWPIEEFRRNRSDIEGNYLAAIDLEPHWGEKLRGATRESRFSGTAENGGYFRKPFGDGWALVGDAGYHKNPITAMGITDAFRDAELVAGALDNVFAGRCEYAEAMSFYQQTRDAEVGAIYELTDEFSQLLPPPPALQQLLGAIQGDQEAVDDFISVQAATLPPQAFFAPENIGRLMGAAGVAA
jgi:flavin-dependent dehydrogenase